jgi:hypothetical protein
MIARYHFRQLLFFIAIAALFVVFPQPSLSEASNKKTLLIHHQAELTFDPQEVIFYPLADNSISEIFQGTLIKRTAPDASRDTHEWSAGAVIERESVPPQIVTGVLYLGSRGERMFFPGVKVAPLESPKQGADRQREELLKAKTELKSLEIQVTTQDATLLRLREDASVIGNLGKIIEVKDEVERVKAQSTMVEQDITHLKQFLTLARNQPTPQNYGLRERTLTSQVRELATAAKEAESHEFSRRARTQGDLQKKLALIEQARKEHFDELQKTLEKLKAQRATLEKEHEQRFKQ